jgi:hypothetical protein
MKTIEERKAILDRAILGKQQSGWLVNNRTDTTCQLTKTQGANGCIGIILCLFFILPGVLYFIFAKKTLIIVISVNENGELAFHSKDFSSGQLKGANIAANKNYNINY